GGFEIGLSVKELRKICQEPVVRENVWYSRVVDRTLSIFITKALLHTPVTANQVTLAYIIIGLLASVVMAFGGNTGWIAGAILLQVFYLLDHVDGELARVRGQASITGTYFDLLSHYIVHPAIFAGISFGLYRDTASLLVFLFGFVAALSAVLSTLVNDIRYVAAYLESSRRIPPRTDRRVAVTAVPETGVNQSLLKRLYFLIAKRLFIGPGIINSITVAVILQLLIGNLRLGTLDISWLYLVLLMYAVGLPLVWVREMANHILKRTPEEAFLEISQNFSE
ncbi:MAG: CDP-alcohol phosphatidyltransferase family protein, partial [Dehalococcoidia bacterium]|nr:CDP-alcohol phosphatidyltransferase family protein [Dehalococcoidia bacterium]